MSGGQNVIVLRRGGAIVQTRAGTIQFGAPPETIKDAMALGLPVPGIFVLPARWFSLRHGLSMAAVEFPLYNNYFMRGVATTVVCDADGERRVRQMLQESVVGPSHIDLDDDFASHVSARARPDLVREMATFRRKDGLGGRDFSLDDLVTFAPYVRDVAQVAAGISVLRKSPEAGGGWEVWVDGLCYARVDELTEPEPVDLPPVTGSFQPPTFGITVLGSSHGFDPMGKTTGFVLWANRRGVLVDPPCETTALLARAGVAPRQVDDVILTHCHADHDSGVFSKLLEEGRVNLHTTPTILSSFLRKYVALTGLSEEHLRRLFVFRPVTIGAPLRIQGAEFHFHYTFHSIPTIGFECYLGGKSFAYSSDTAYDPALFARMLAAGEISQTRHDELATFPAHHNLIIHEAGVPPIHTPVERLVELPPAVKERVRVIHIAEKDLPPHGGLCLARAGFEHTIRLEVPDSQHADALVALDALSSIEMFRDLSVEKAREFLTIARRIRVPAGQVIIEQGKPGDRFYIMLAGEAVVRKDGTPIKVHGRGRFFGETALVTGAPRSASVQARTDCELMAVDKYDFLAFLRGTENARALVRLAENRDLPSWELLEENAVFRELSDSQKTQMQAVLEATELPAGLDLWAERGEVKAAWLLDTAVVELPREGATVRLGRASFLGHATAIALSEPQYTGRRAVSLPPIPTGQGHAQVITAGRAFRIRPQDFAKFLHHNPRVYMSLAGSRYVE